MEGGTVDTIDTVDDFLEHFGVKGMRWGHRKPETPRQKSFRQSARQERKERKADDKWEKNIYSMKGAIAVHNNVADRMNGSPGKPGEIDKHNSNPKWKDKDLTKNKKLEKAYFDEFEKVTERVYAEAVTAVHGVSPSSKKAAFYVNDQHGERIEVRSGTSAVRIVHAESDENTSPDLVFMLTRDAMGIVTKTEKAPNVSDEELKQFDTVDDFLMHYGVKGMRWGVRRSAAERAAPSAVKEKNKPSAFGSQDIKVKAKAGRGVVSTRGGRRNVATAEAITAAAARQKAKASTTDALTNAEMKKTIERMNLEQQFKKLAKEQAKQDRGKKFVDAILKAAGGDVVGATASAASATKTTATQIVPRKAIGG